MLKRKFYLLGCSREICSTRSHVTVREEVWQGYVFMVTLTATPSQLSPYVFVVSCTLLLLDFYSMPNVHFARIWAWLLTICWCPCCGVLSLLSFRFNPTRLLFHPSSSSEKWTTIMNCCYAHGRKPQFSLHSLQWWMYAYYAQYDFGKIYVDYL